MTTTDANTSVARVPTTSGSRYLQQLCKHWGHKFEATFDADHGEVNFGDSICIMDAEPETLVVTVKVGEPGELPMMQKVVADHLDRFAFREAPLSFDWK